MASMMDMLLAADPAKLSERPTANLKIKRLQDLFGEAAEIEIRSLTMQQIDDLRGKEKEHYILEAVTNIDFANKELCESLKPAGRETPLLPTECVRRLFLPGEIDKIFNEISDLSGYGPDALEKIEKN